MLLRYRSTLPVFDDLSFIDNVSFCEAVAAVDELTRRQRFGVISITTRSGFVATSRAMSELLTTSDTVGGFGFTACEPLSSFLALLAHRPVDQQGSCVGAVLSYTRQPKQIRKNTGGRDWLRVSLRVRETRALRGLLWRFSRLRALANGVGFSKGSPSVGYLASASALHWVENARASCGFVSEWRVSQGLIYASYLGV